MRPSRRLAFSIFACALAGCAGEAPSSDPAPLVCDAASHVDFGDTVRDTRALVVARDGTIYFGQPDAIGRRLPDGTLDAAWVALAGAGSPKSLLLDASNETLLAVTSRPGELSSPSFRVEIATRNVSSDDVHLGTGPMTIGPDGMLYYVDVSAVMRASPAGGPASTVAAFPYDEPTGLAFDRDGNLIVVTENPSNGYLYRLGLDANGVETSREWPVMLRVPVGVQLDARGRFYVGTTYWPSVSGNQMLRFDADGSNRSLVLDEVGGSEYGGASSLDFGHGALCESDLYIANDRIVRLPTDAAGAPVPWH